MQHVPCCLLLLNVDLGVQGMTAASPTSRTPPATHTAYQYQRDFEGAAECLNRLLVALNGEDHPVSRERVGGGGRNGDLAAQQALRSQGSLPPIVSSSQVSSTSISSCRSTPILQRHDSIFGVPQRIDSFDGPQGILPSSVLPHGNRKAARLDAPLPRVAGDERSHLLSRQEELGLLQARFGEEIDRLRAQLWEREEELGQLRDRECEESRRALAATEAHAKLGARFHALELELAESKAQGVSAEEERTRQLSGVLMQLQICSDEREDLRVRGDSSETTARELADLRLQLQTALSDHRKQELDLEVSQLSQQLRKRNAELDAMRAQVSYANLVADELAVFKSKCLAQEQELIESRVIEKAQGRLCECKEELESLRARNASLLLQNGQLETELSEKTAELKRFERDQEKQLDDAVGFVRKIAQTSAEPQLEKSYNFGTMEVIGMGHYGFVVVCQRSKASERVVLKLQSERWAGVALREWSHGSELRHAHIVRYVDAVMHKDAHYDIKARLRAAFLDGTLHGREPKFFPQNYFCLGIEFMDRGTLQRLVDEQPPDVRSVGAVTRQIASALAYMHKRQRTHNDIKPENVLLRMSPAGDCLIAKLADLGLADHSMDRHHDCELFAYTVWCLSLHCPFERCPSSNADRQLALDKFRAVRASAGNRRCKNLALWDELEKVVEGMWRECGLMEMAEVDYIDSLQDLVISLPTGEAVDATLEAHARRDAERRCRTVSDFYYRKRVRSHTMPDLSKRSPPTSDDETDSSSEAEEDSTHQNVKVEVIASQPPRKTI